MKVALKTLQKALPSTGSYLLHPNFGKKCLLSNGLLQTIFILFFLLLFFISNKLISYLVQALNLLQYTLHGSVAVFPTAQQRGDVLLIATATAHETDGESELCALCPELCKGQGGGTLSQATEALI